MTIAEAQMWWTFWLLMIAAWYFVKAERMLRVARAERAAAADQCALIDAAAARLAAQRQDLAESETRIAGMIAEAVAEGSKLEGLRRGLIEGLGLWDLGMREEAFEALGAAGVPVDGFRGHHET